MSKILLENPKPAINLYMQTKNGEFKPAKSTMREGYWCCGECGEISNMKDYAENCCKVKYCDCGNIRNPYYYSQCSSCRFKYEEESKIKRLNEAELVESYDGWVHSEYISSDKDGYFENVEALLEYIEDHNSDEEDEDNQYEIPEFVFTCKEIVLKPFLNADEILESIIADNFHEDAHEQVDFDSLQKVLDDWADQQSLVSYEVDYSKKVRVIA